MSGGAASHSYSRSCSYLADKHFEEQDTWYILDINRWGGTKVKIYSLPFVPVFNRAIVRIPPG